MVEFAIFGLIFFILIFAIAEFGLILFDKAMMTNASREGARAGIVFRATPDGEYNPLTVTEIETVIRRYLGDYLVSFKPSNATVSIPAICTGAGAELRVNVSYQYDFLVLPRLVKSLAGSIPLAAETVMRCE